MQFYSYMYLREDGTPFYVGKGSGLRAFHHSRGMRAPKDKSRILIFLRATEAEALATEKELIVNWGRKDLGTGCLHNRTDGGDGTAGFKWSTRTEEHLQKMRAANLGHPDYSTRSGMEKAAATKRTPEYRTAAAARQKAVWATRGKTKCQTSI